MNNKKTPIFYGWIDLAAVWLVYFFTAGPVGYGNSVVTTLMVADKGLNEQFVGWVITVYGAANALFSIPAGFADKRFGFRRAMLIGTTVVVVGCVGIFAIGDSTVMYAALIFLIGLGTTLSGLVSGPGMINEWFELNKALPMSLLLTAGAIGGCVMPIVSEFVVSRFGWRLCWLIYAIMAAICIPIILFVVKNRPLDIGEEKDGVNWRRTHSPLVQAAQSENSVEGMGFTSALKTGRFYVLCGGFLGIRIMFSACVSYLMLYAVSLGVSYAQAATLLSLMNFAGIAGRLSGSVVGKTKIPTYILNTGCYVLMLAGGVLLSQSKTEMGLAVAALMIGFAFSASFSLLALLLPEYFGNKDYATMFGTINTVGSVGAALAPVLMVVLAGSGLIYKNGYIVFSVVVGLCAVAAALTPPKKRRAIKCCNGKCTT